MVCTKNTAFIFRFSGPFLPFFILIIISIIKMSSHPLLHGMKVVNCIFNKIALVRALFYWQIHLEIVFYWFRNYTLLVTTSTFSLSFCGANLTLLESQADTVSVILDGLRVSVKKSIADGKSQFGTSSSHLQVTHKAFQATCRIYFHIQWGQ